MGDTPETLLQRRHCAAVDAVRIELEKDPAFTNVLEGNVAPILKHCSAIWRTKVRISDKDWSVDVGLPPFFPDDPPIACVVDSKELVLRNPHVLDHGFLCTIPSSAAINSHDPVGLTKYVFEDAERILRGTSANDFREEFTYYWARAATNREQDVLIVDPIEQLGQTFPVVFCKGYICVASSAERLNRWASNWTGSPSTLKDEELGIAIQLTAPLLPSDYPQTLAQLISITENNDSSAAERLKHHIATSLGKGLALLVQKEGQGAALGGVIFEGLGLKHLEALSHGFRLGNAPPDVLCARGSKLIASTVVTRSAVIRVDHHWLHSRGGDGRDLSEKSVLLIGCGSIGGYVAHLLSRAGVGRLTITDNDKLGWANLGRHILGASSVWRWKADALAEELTRELPHLKITSIPKDWRDAFAANPNLFIEHDIVVCTTGDWRCEGPLNALTRNVPMPPVFFGWLEPHAVAGHCLGIATNGGCFQCAANEFGQFTHSVATFAKSPLSKEPGGCTHYQRYGPTALMPVASMISSIVVESLLTSPSDSFLSTWISSAEHLKAVDAELSEAWMVEVNQGGYSRMYRKRWDSSKSCVVCASRIS